VLTLESLARTVIGLDVEVPVLGGRRRYVNLDNAATTPALGPVRDAVDRFLPMYSSVHRGTGWKSRVSTEVYEESRRIVGAFLGADPALDTVIYGKNATEMVNKLARRIDLGSDRVVLISDMEHHSNDLPWRRVAQVERVPVDARGAMDPDLVRKLLRRAHGRVKLVAVSGASNVTGYLPDVHELAAIAHENGARILVDCAQLAPHRRIDMRPHDDPGHLDFVVLSAHKMYAPYGTGALIGPRGVFAEGDPDHVGGGVVDVVTPHVAYWAAPPDKDEPGTPNLLGAVALAKVCRLFEEVGWDALVAHERELTAHALRRLKRIDGVRLYGDDDETLARDRVGVVPFNLRGVNHALAAAALGWEAGVGVRHGCFCAHPFIAHLLALDPEEHARMMDRVLQEDRREIPGLVRMSFGLYNTRADVDLACDAIERLLREGPKADYTLDVRSGEYAPISFPRDELEAARRCWE
jgi:selenocysteine lyase/cysteine desulfurase